MNSSIETFSGILLSLDQPSPAQINLDDVAHGLSNCCRFAGQCRVFYSVAEHSFVLAKMLGARGFDERTQLWALLHDAAEAYLGDWTRPLKGLLGALAQEIEERVLQAILEAVEFQPSGREQAIIKDADTVLLATEAYRIMCSRGLAWDRPGTADLSVELYLWPPAAAENSWATRFNFLRGSLAAEGRL